MTLTELLFRLLARLAPMLWYAHRLGYFLRVAVRVIEDEPCLNWLADNPEGRVQMEGMLADFEHVVDILIGLRTRQLLGLAVSMDRPGLRRFARIHTAPCLDQLLLRTARLIARAQDVERLARRRAARLRQEREAAPVLLTPNHQPESGDPACDAIAWLMSHAQPRATLCAFAPDIAGLRIRAPP